MEKNEKPTIALKEARQRYFKFLQQEPPKLSYKDIFENTITSLISKEGMCREDAIIIARRAIKHLKISVASMKVHRDLIEKLVNEA